ncbi:hypothetical protein CISIN_1g040211mg, partial [Citrus sinensis]
SNLWKHLINGGALPREPMPSGITARLPTLEDLEAYAIGQWERFLLQLISSAQAERSINFCSSTMKVFQRGLLIQRDKEAPRLTESGFQFLLMDTNAQLWYIVREYISNSQHDSMLAYERGINQADLISFLLELSFHVAGEAYNLKTLSEIQRSMIKDFADLGLVKLQQGRKESWFIPTIADSLETNFRMYAYSTSKLHCEILRLFSKIEYQLPNLIVGAITKESLYNAVENGLTAEQQNAHPRVADRIPSVLENVCDQIRLWESDLNRVEMTPAHYYDEFPSREDSKKMRLVVNAEIHMHMREFLRGQNK